MKYTLKGVLCLPFMFSIFALQFLRYFLISIIIQATMEFRQEELVEREREIASYLLKDFSLKMVSQKTGLSLNHLAAHISNMRIKLKAKDIQELIKLLKVRKS